MKNKIRVGVIYGLSAIVFSLIMDQVINFLVMLNLLSEPSEIKLDGLGLVNMFILIVIIAPTIEELFYRWLPIKAISLITKNKSALWIVIIISSAGFGISHGSWHHLFLQGMVGIIFSIAFLKGGYPSSVVAHSTHNFMLFILIYLKQI